jgi:hypothetical protein
MCCCGRSKKAALPNHESDKFRSWQRRALFVTGLIITMCVVAVKVYSLQMHWAERYQKYLAEATINKAVGADLVLGSCKNKPLDHKSHVLDCVRAREMYDTDPDTEARNKAYEHLFEDHLSVLSLLGGCHDGICSSLLWRFADKVLHHYQFTVMIAVVVFCVTVFVAIWIYVNCHLALRAKRKVERLAKGNPGQQAAAQLYDALDDLAKVRGALRVSGGGIGTAGPRIAAVEQAYKKAIQTNADIAKCEAILDPDAHFLHHRGQPFRLEDNNSYKQSV